MTNQVYSKGDMPKYKVATTCDGCKKKIERAVLDKIRAEIMKLQTYKMFEGEDTVYVECEDVLQVIDKYRSEGSGEE